MRLLLAVVCATTMFAIQTNPQTSAVIPLRVAAGTVVTFHVQSRLRSATDDALGGLPQGTTLQVKLADSIDSTQSRDGAPFHGTLVTAISSGDTTIHPEAEVHGILILLRSKNHPNGFRYELMVTGISENGQWHPLTASLSASLFETAASAIHTSAAAPTNTTP
jgi:hypothetical protein